MSRRDNLVAVGSEPDSASATEQAQTAGTEHEELVIEEAWEEDAARRGFAWVVPTLAVLAVLGWSGFFGWAHQREIMDGGTPQEWSAWIVSWSVPVLLVVALWILAMRNSRREASRFAEAASALSHESSRLEQRL